MTLAFAAARAHRRAARAARWPIASTRPRRRFRAAGGGRTARPWRRSHCASGWPKGTLAKFLGYGEAPDEKAVFEAAVKEFKIAQALRDRIVAQRDEL